MGLALANTPPLTAQDLFNVELQKAVALAADAHAGQFRRLSGLPYLTHPLQVLDLVAEWGVLDPATFAAHGGSKHEFDLAAARPDLITWKAALCHDVPEERPDIPAKRLVLTIGADAALVCEELTFRPDRAGPLTEAQQKAEYMKTFMAKSARALVVKCADRICNTLDFLRYDAPYAPKYWRKAERLFEAMFSRAHEITRVLGPHVITGIKFSKDSTQRRLA